MRQYSVVIACIALCSLSARSGWAEATRELSISGPREVLDGDPETASIDAHGEITMGPQVVELGHISERTIVTLISGPGGATYAGTANGKALRVGAGGESKVLFTQEGLVASALAFYKGTLHVALSPDGKVLALGADGKSKTFADTKAKYVWAMLEDGPNLLVATGEPGAVKRLGPNGAEAGPAFQPGETHVRALIKHPRRGIIAGGGQKGIVYQLNGASAFALYDSEMEEVTSFAIDPTNGDLYASLVSESKPGTIDPEKSIGAVAGDGPESEGSPIKGSEVVRISESGRTDVVWTSKREGALGLAFDVKARRLYISTAASSKSRGRIYALEVSDRDRLLLATRVDVPHASALLLAPTGGALIVGTGPAGRVFRVGPGVRTESTYVSSEQDLQRTSTIGRIWFDAVVPTGAHVDIAIRSGNTKEHDKTWSGWSADVAVKEGGDVKVPQGRYVQIRARLRAAPNGRAPSVKSLHASVLRKNIAPIVQEVFLLRRGVYLSKMPKEEEREKTVTLSKSVIHGLRAQSEDDEPRSVRVRQGSRLGMLTVSWRSDDANGDELLYRLEMRRLDDPPTPWTVVANDLTESFYSFDSRQHADGRYQFRVTASDVRSNPLPTALSDQNESAPQTIDNTPPRISNLRATSPAAGRIHVEADVQDDTSVIGTAEFAVNGGPWLMLQAADGLIDAKTEKLVADVGPSSAPGTPSLKPGLQTVLVRVEDDAGNSATASATFTIK